MKHRAKGVPSHSLWQVSLEDLVAQIIIRLLPSITWAFDYFNTLRTILFSSRTSASTGFCHGDLASVAL
jgi:hypothetical protein